MYHGAGYRKLGRKTQHRLAMFANAMSSLIQHERIKTTVAKAKEIRPLIEKMITKGKSGTLHDRRQVFSYLRNDAAVGKLFEVIAPRFKDRKGGYTRILKIADTRVGDGAETAVLEFVDYVLPPSKTKEDKKKDRAEAKKKEAADRKATAASRPVRDRAGPSSGRTKKTGKAGASASMKGSGSRGT
jgi:large subunit ribosomal protein L17